jgi:hypothetical protein
VDRVDDHADDEPREKYLGEDKDGTPYSLLSFSKEPVFLGASKDHRGNSTWKARGKLRASVMNASSRWVVPDGNPTQFSSAMAAHIAYIRCLPVVTPEFGALHFAFRKFFFEGCNFQILGPSRDPVLGIEEFTLSYDHDIEAQILLWLLHYLTRFYSFFHWAAFSIPLCHYRLVHELKHKFPNSDSVKKCPQSICHSVERNGHWLNDSLIAIPFSIKLFEDVEKAKLELGRSPSVKELHGIVTQNAAFFVMFSGHVDEGESSDELSPHSENDSRR